jgi:hypothetical protein
MNSADTPQAKACIAQIISLVAPFSMTERLASKIYRAYGQDSVSRLKENPYALARDVFGIGEQTAAEIATILETKLDTTFSTHVPTKAKQSKQYYCGPGNGKLSEQNFIQLQQKLQYAPKQILPTEWPLHNPDHWTVPDLKRAVSWWFDVSWAHDSSYRNLFKKCKFAYCRKQKVFLPQSTPNRP